MATNTKTSKTESSRIKFYSRQNPPKRKPTVAGKGTKTTYKLEIDKETGAKKLVENGEEDIYAKIQEALEPTKIYNILARYEQGDLGALNKMQGMYADITGIPTNLIDAQRKIQETQTAFSKLPVEIKSQFDNDPYVFIAKMINGEGQEIIDKAIREAEHMAEVQGQKTPEGDKTE